MIHISCGEHCQNINHKHTKTQHRDRINILFKWLHRVGQVTPQAMLNMNVALSYISGLQGRP